MATTHIDATASPQALPLEAGKRYSLQNVSRVAVYLADASATPQADTRDCHTPRPAVAKWFPPPAGRAGKRSTCARDGPTISGSHMAGRQKKGPARWPATGTISGPVSAA